MITHLPPPYTVSLLTNQLSNLLGDINLLSSASQPTFALIYYQGDDLSLHPYNSLELGLLDGTVNLEDYALSLSHCEHAHVLIILDSTSHVKDAQQSTTREKLRARLTRVRPGKGRVYVHVGEAGELWKVVREAEVVEEVVRRALMRAVGVPGYDWTCKVDIKIVGNDDGEKGGLGRKVRSAVKES